MNFGFGKAQDKTAKAGLSFAAPKICSSVRFNLRKPKAIACMALRAGCACSGGAPSGRVPVRKAVEQSDILFKPLVAAALGVIFAEMVEETVILATSTAQLDLWHAVSRRQTSKRCRYPSTCRGNRRVRAVSAVASTAEYVVKDAAQCRELDINQAMVSPEKNGVIAASALTRRRR